MASTVIPAKRVKQARAGTQFDIQSDIIDDVLYFLRMLPRVPEEWTPLQRGLFASLSGVFVVMLAFGFFSLSKSLRAPFEPKTNGQFLTLDEQEKQQDEALKFRDTDGDNLTDWDEIHLYHTSPFLSDTDSDGIADGAEIKGNTDPNCPEGKTCSASPAAAAAPAKANPADLLSPQNFATLPTLGDGTPDLSAFDPKQVRAMLKSAGMSDAQLNQISDTDLKAVYLEVLQGDTGSSAETTSTTAKSATTSTPSGSRVPTRTVATSTGQ